MNSKVLPILEVVNTDNEKYYINVYQIILIQEETKNTFKIRTNNFGTIKCKGNAKEFIEKIKKE